MPEVFTTVHRDAIVAAAVRHRVPAVYSDEISTTRGELMSYGIDPADVFRRSASYVDRILRGEKRRRPAGAESDQIQADDQSQDSEGDRSFGAAAAARARRYRGGISRNGASLPCAPRMPRKGRAGSDHKHGDPAYCQCDGPQQVDVDPAAPQESNADPFVDDDRHNPDRR